MQKHTVLDLHYTPDEGQVCFIGTIDECEEFLQSQSPQFMYKIVPMTIQEIETYKKIEENEENI